MDKYTREIIIRTTFRDVHCWPEAPEEVRFLRHPHRHEFHVRVGIPVEHNDRDREFFIEQGKLDEALVAFRNGEVDIRFSCEDVAERILEIMAYAKWAEVSEDGENGVRLERR